MTYRDPYRRYRRQMRRAFRRNAGYPVLFPIPYESVSMVAAAGLSRWLYRHRSAFLPFIITAAAFFTATDLHAHHREWFLAITAITGSATFVLGVPHRLLWGHPAGKLTTSVLTRAWEKYGIDRPIERAYTTAVIAATGGWLAAATAIGPASKPMPQIALIGTVILGIPWWAHRRRRAKVRALRIIQTWPTIAENMGLPGSRIASIVVDVWGWTARVALHKGTTTGQAISHIPAIESGLGLPPGTARVTPDPSRADRFTLRVIETDPHAQPIPWPGPTTQSVTPPITLGLSENGEPVTANILRRNILIAGTTGAGKSGIENILTAELTECRDAELWAVDLKGGMELRPWEPCLARPPATTPQQANTLFREAVTTLNKRAAHMAAHGKRVWEPSPDDPAIIIIVDEYAELPDEAHDCADSISRRGRAVAVNIIAATQRPTQEAMGRNAVRSQMDVRICLRVRERRDVDLVLGQGAFSSGWHAHQLTKPGEFLISSPEHTMPQRFRAYLITDHQVTQQATRHPHTRLTESQPVRHPHAPEAPQGHAPAQGHTGSRADPDTALWDALRHAGPNGATVAELTAACGMRRRWVYYRLSEHAAAGRTIQVKRGRWRAAPPAGGQHSDGRPPPRPAPGRPPRGPRRDRRRPPRDGNDA